MKKINLSLKLSIIVLVTGFCAYFTQNHLWVNAGKNIQSKSYSYSFQSNLWEYEAALRFNELAESGLYHKLNVAGGEKTVNKEFLLALQEYHQKIREIALAQSHNSEVAYNIMADVAALVPKGLYQIPNPEEVTKKLAEYEKTLIKHNEMAERLATFYPELISAFEYDGNESLDEKVALSVKQVELLRELYTSEYLFLNKKSDSFQIITDLGKVSKDMLKTYDLLLAAYNKEVDEEDSNKKLLLLMLTVISLIVSITLAISSE